MGFRDKLRAYARIFRERDPSRPLETMDLLKQRKALLLGVNAFELAQAASGRVDDRLKLLAQLKTSALVGCPF